MLASTKSWLVVQISSDAFKCIIGAVYFHPEDNISETLQCFRDVIDNIQLQFYECPIILGGDFNARVGVPEVLPEELLVGTALDSCGETTDETLNRRGALLNEWMSDFNFVLVNGRSVSDCPAKITFRRNQSKSIIDLVWVNIAGLSIIRDLEVLPQVTFSDHFPVLLSLCDVGYVCNNDELMVNKPSVVLSWNPDIAATFKLRMQWSPLVIVRTP